MQNAQKVARALGDIRGMSGKGTEHGNSCLSQSLCRTCQKKRAAFALGMLFGLRGALARALDFLRALPLGFAVGGVLTSGGGTGPPLAKYRFFFSANLTCIDAEHCFRGCCEDVPNKRHSPRLRPDSSDSSQTANTGDG